MPRSEFFLCTALTIPTVVRLALVRTSTLPVTIVRVGLAFSMLPMAVIGPLSACALRDTTSAAAARPTDEIARRPISARPVRVALSWSLERHRHDPARPNQRHGRRQSSVVRAARAWAWDGAAAEATGDPYAA